MLLPLRCPPCHHVQQTVLIRVIFAHFTMTAKNGFFFFCHSSVPWGSSFSPYFDTTCTELAEPSLLLQDCLLNIYINYIKAIVCIALGYNVKKIKKDRPTGKIHELPNGHFAPKVYSFSHIIEVPHSARVQIWIRSCEIGWCGLDPLWSGH